MFKKSASFEQVEEYDVVQEEFEEVIVKKKFRKTGLAPKQRSRDSRSSTSGVGFDGVDGSDEEEMTYAKAKFRKTGAGPKHGFKIKHGPSFEDP